MRLQIPGALLAAFLILFFVAWPILLSTTVLSPGWIIAILSMIISAAGLLCVILFYCKTLRIDFTIVIFISHFFFNWLFTRQPDVWPANLRPVLFIPIVFILTYLCSLAVGLIWKLLTSPKAMAFLWSDDIKTSRKYYLQEILVLTAALFILFVMGPVHIASAGNIGIDGFLLIKTAVACCLIAGIIVFVLIKLLSKRYKFIEATFTAFLLLIVINAFIMPFQAGLLDGGELGLPVEDIIPLFRNVAAFLVLYFVAAKFRKNLRFIAVPIVAFAIGLTVFNLQSVQRADVIPQEEVIANAVNFSTDQNIVIIVADMLQGTIADYMFEEYPHLLDAFDGFTLFTRAFTSFPFTRFSRETIHSGMLYSMENPSSQEEHLRASVSDSFMSDMQQAGASVSGFHISLFGEFPSVPNFNDPTPALQLYGYTLAASIARLTGYWTPNPFGGHALDLVMADSIGSINAHNVLRENIRADDVGLKLLYFWDYTMHTPVVFSRDGNIRSEPAARNDVNAIVDEMYFGLGQLTRLFDSMKEQGVYDNSLIIIVSDHGHGFGENIFHEDAEAFGNFLPVFRYNTALFVKPPTSRGTAQISHNPAWTGDVRALVNFYHDNFENISPVDVVAEIRSINPYVGVLFAPDGMSMPEMWTSKEHHQLVSVQSLYDIPEAFNGMR